MSEAGVAADELGEIRWLSLAGVVSFARRGRGRVDVTVGAAAPTGWPVSRSG